MPSLADLIGDGGLDAVTAMRPTPDPNRVGLYREGDMVSPAHARELCKALPEGWALLPAPMGAPVFLRRASGLTHDEFLRSQRFLNGQDVNPSPDEEALL